MYNRTDPVLAAITNELVLKHRCHTVILYGSRAFGDFDAGSDYDVIGIRESGETEKDCRLFEGYYLDAFIYPEGPIDEPDSFLIRLKDGIVLLQKETQGDELLRNINDIYEQGPPDTPEWEKKEILAWLPKMLDRAKRADIEGNYRKHWLLTELLPIYFKLHNLWYLGPKKSFPWLKIHNARLYDAYQRALGLNADYHSICNLINLIFKLTLPT